MIGVLASGEGTNLQALLDAGLPVAAVASDRREARALLRAEHAGVEARAFELERYASREERDLALAGWLEEQGVELVVLAGYMRILCPAFLDRFPGRVINVHPSLLPAFPGLRAIEQAVAAGVAETGVTVHVVDEGVDTGPVLRQVPVPVEPAATLAARLHEVEHRLLPEVVRSLCVR